jgi:quercetin dioxygenase-like cupin family protein
MFLRFAFVASVLCGLSCLSAANAAEPAADETATACSASEVLKISVQEFDKVEVQKYPWGWIRWLMNSQLDPKSEMTFGVVYIKPNQSNPLHIHPNCEECLHVLSGSCEHLLGDKWIKLKKGDTLRIPLGVRHAARTGDESCRAVIVYNTGDRQFEPVGEDTE